jgi:hypothetical protein
VESKEGLPEVCHTRGQNLFSRTLTRTGPRERIAGAEGRGVASPRTLSRRVRACGDGRCPAILDEFQEYAMFKWVVCSIVLLLTVIGFAAGDEFEAAITDPSRAFTKRAKTPGELNYARLTLDSKGKVVSTVYKGGIVTKDTKVVMGKYNKKTKEWEAGEPVEGGVSAGIFKKPGKVVYLLVTLGDDKKTITQILVKKVGGELVRADPEFDAIYKRHGPQTNGRGTIAYVRTELNDKGEIIKTFPLTRTLVTADTKYVMGKYNEKEKQWEAGEAIKGGVYNDIFKELGARTYYVRITMRADGRGVAQFLLRQIGEKKK